MNHNSTNDESRPRAGCHQHDRAALTNTQEEGIPPMSTSQATASLADAATETLTLPERSTIEAAPRWAEASEIVPECELIVHTFVSPVPVHICTGHTDRPLEAQSVTLQQCDLLLTDGDAVTGSVRQAATVEVTLPGGSLFEAPVDEARVLHAVLGQLLTRHDAAKSDPAPALTATERTATFPCLPDCDTDHKPGYVQECHNYAHVGTTETELASRSLSIDSYGATEGPRRYATVQLDRKDQHPDDATFMSSTQARSLAALLLAGADKADQLAGITQVEGADRG